MKDVSKQEFEKSFEKHYKNYKNIQPSNSSTRLLLFYAVECGLKSLIMSQEHVFLFSKLSEEEQNCKHDLKKLLKILGVEEKYKLKAIKTNRGESITCGHYNEFWRYGLQCAQKEIDENKEMQIEEELKKIAEWIMERK